jgi:hypothetical protein
MQATGRDQEPRSWTLRVLAPVALVATVCVLIIVVVGSLGDSDSDGGETTEPTTTAAKGCDADPPNPPADAAIENGFYVIKVGETLQTVSERTCVSGERLEQLNPELDPLQLPVGACVNQRRDACAEAG